MGLRSVAVFAGSRPSTRPAYAEAAYALGRRLAQDGVELVYGAGGGGLMGEVSQGALDAGGRVVGFIPRAMVEREWGRHDITELHVVDTMHERKAGFARRADAFLVLPGGLGTLEEAFEVWTWRQIGFSSKPIAFLDVDGFWQPLVALVESMVDAGFVSRESADDVIFTSDLDEAIDGLQLRLARSEAT